MKSTLPKSKSKGVSLKATHFKSSGRVHIPNIKVKSNPFSFKVSGKR